MLKSTLLEAVHAAANEMRRFIDLEFKISNKEGINNLVTEVDHASEKAIMDVIKKNYPDHHILTEESGDLIQDSSHAIPSTSSTSRWYRSLTTAGGTWSGRSAAGVPGRLEYWKV